jgi:ABC-type multidrug transport system fused ATPase/permease subunit
MFAVGGVLKFLGDLTGLVGPLSISYIVEYIEQKSTKSNNSLPNANISNLQPVLTGTLDSDNTIYDTAVDYFDENGPTNQIYAPDWHDFVTNGWIICVLVLIASLAQGTFSQTSTHLVNLEGIRLKNALQGLVYRKTLSLNLNNSANAGQSSGGQRRRSSANNSGGHKSGDKNSRKHGVNGLQNHRQQLAGAERGNTTPLQQPNGNDNGNDNDVDGGNNDEMQMQDAGTITNLMSEDTFNVMSFFWIAHYVWAIPLKVGKHRWGGIQ